MELTMKDLEKDFNNAIQMGTLFIGVKIQTRGSEGAEVIINPRENFETKLEYYKRSYDDTLTLKTFDGIKIVCIAYGDCFDDIECYFENFDK